MRAARNILLVVLLLAVGGTIFVVNVMAATSGPNLGETVVVDPTTPPIESTSPGSMPPGSSTTPSATAPPSDQAIPVAPCAPLAGEDDDDDGDGDGDGDGDCDDDDDD